MTSEQSSGGAAVIQVTEAELDTLVARGSGGSISPDEVFVLLHGVEPDPDFIEGLRAQLATRGVELEEVEVDAEVEVEAVLAEAEPAERIPSAGAAAATARRNARSERAQSKPRSRN